MSLRRFYLAIMFLLVGACGSGESVDVLTQNAAPLKPLPSNEEIIAVVYDNSYQVPDQFFVDERAATVQSYSLYHVKDESISYELCTNDFAEAQSWEEADNTSRAVNGFYVGSYENENYFEFIRELSFPESVGNIQDLTSPGFARVFKCNSIDRDGVDRNLRDGYGGTINRIPLTASVVREFVEYLWQFTYFDIAQGKVLDSFSNERPTAYDHTLLLAFRINQGIDQCDRIEVFDWEFSVAKSSGSISRDFRFLFALEAQLENGIPEQCQ